MTAIVQVNVAVTTAPTPNKLQQSFALVSQGATNTSQGAMTLLTTSTSIVPYLKSALSLTTITQTVGLATATAAAAHGFPIGDVVKITIAGATQAGYNGTFLCTVTTTSAFTYAVPAGTTTPATGSPVYTVEDVAELTQMNATWFANGSTTAVWVLELGLPSFTDAIPFLSTWIGQNPGVFYGYVVPRPWDATSAFLSLAAGLSSTTSLTYFFTTTTLATYTSYPTTSKAIVPLIEAPTIGTWPANVFTGLTYATGLATATTTTAHGVAVGQWFQVVGCTPIGYNGYWQAVTGTTGTTLVWAIATNPGAESVLGSLVASYYASAGIPSTEFSVAAEAFNVATWNPGGTNRVNQLLYSPVSGVTPFPTQGNQSLQTTLAAANLSLIGTGAEGGISGTIILGGETADGNPFNFWYAVDWTNINVNLALSNAVINGSVPGPAPLLLNQDGVNYLQEVGAGTISAGISYGLIFGTLVQTELDPVTFANNSNSGLYNGFAVINAVPFQTYYNTNPGNYKIGLYGGFAISMSPQRGFANIIITLNATQFVG